jgi:hypothetical protein
VNRGKDTTKARAVSPSTPDQWEDLLNPNLPPTEFEAALKRVLESEAEMEKIRKLNKQEFQSVIDVLGRVSTLSRSIATVQSANVLPSSTWRPGMWWMVSGNNASSPFVACAPFEKSCRAHTLWNRVSFNDRKSQTTQEGSARCGKEATTKGPSQSRGYLVELHSGKSAERSVKSVYANA